MISLQSMVVAVRMASLCSGFVGGRRRDPEDML